MNAREKEVAPASCEMRVLMLPATGADGIAVTNALSECDIQCDVVDSMSSLCRAIADSAGIVLISDEHLLTEPVALIGLLGQQEVWSDLPILVLTAAGHQSAELERALGRLGNVSLIGRPVQVLSLVSLVRSSLRARRRQYQVREYLAEQREAQRQIRAGEQRYRLLIENVSDYAIFMLDLDGRVASWNSGAQQLLGYSHEQIVGRPCDVLFSEEDRDNGIFERELRAARTSGRATSAGWRVRRNGARLFVEGILSAVRDEQGQLRGYAKFMRDVTERQRTHLERERLLESERAARSEAERAGYMKDEFLATLGHELRTPLNAVLGWSQILRRLKNLPREVLEGLAIIERNGRSQAQIIEDLLDMSAIVSGKIHLEIQRVDLGAVIDATMSSIRPAAEAKEIRLQLVLDPQVPAVNGDPGRLQQVFWNLLTNAVKFTPKAGLVAVTLARVKSHVEVRVADDGEGIDPTFLPHVFDRFRQADASSTRRYGGLGLGLSIVKQLVELHGGRIGVESEGVGRGATFRVVLPLPATSLHPRASEPRREHSDPGSESGTGIDTARPDLHGADVLVVDDDTDARSLVRRLLTDCNAVVRIAGSAAEALEQIQLVTPDVLISDIGMPGEDGYSLIQRIRALQGRKARIPAIALTAYARAEDRVKVLQAGYERHLAKPVEPSGLLKIVVSLLEGSDEEVK